MGDIRQSQLIQEFVETIENDPQDLLLEGGTENFLKNNNIAYGKDFMNAVLKHYSNLSPKIKITLLTIEFLQGEYELISENNRDFLMDHYVGYLSKDPSPLVDAIFSRKLLRDKTCMRDMIRPEFIKKMIELPGCPDDLKNIYKLKNIGFGRMADKETGEIVYKMKDGNLVDKNYPEGFPPEFSSPYTDDNGEVWEWFGDVCDECKKHGANPQHAHWQEVIYDD